MYLANDGASNTYIGRYNNLFLAYGGGNVGIGTTSLSAKLTVTKGAQSDTVSVANSAAYLYGADVGLIIGQYASGPYGTWLQSIRADNVTFPLSLQPSGGNVGIGTSNPITKLHVAINDNTFAGAALLENTNSGTSALSTISFKTANNASTFAVGQVNNGGGAILYNGANTSMTFSTNASTRMTIAAGGNIGINTTSPSAMLHVDGDMRLQNSATSVDTITFSNGPQIVANGPAGYFKSGNVYTNTLSGNGEVGIGTSSPNAKLDVNGNTLITGSLRVTAGITGSLNGNADTATSVAWTDSAVSTFAIAMSDGTTAYYEGAGDLRWDGGSKVISVSDGAETLSLNGKYIVQTGTGLLNYYADRHVFGDNAFNYQGQLIGGSFDAALDITCGGTKFFDIPHQSKSGWGLKHGAIEGPESAVYFRGKLEADNIIQFPAYWEWLVHSETITVSLTPVGSFQPLYVEKIENNQAIIASNGEPINCHFVVYAERKDVDRWDVEYPGYSRGNISDSE